MNINPSDVERIQLYINRDGRAAALSKCKELIHIYAKAALALKRDGLKRTTDAEGNIVIIRPGKRRRFYSIYVEAALSHRAILRAFNFIFTEASQ